MLSNRIYHRAPSLRLPILYRQPAGVDTVALTFEDGPSPESTPYIMQQLDRVGGKATFFLSGVRVAAHPGLAREIVAAGHAVYGHGWEHVDHEETGAQEVVVAMQLMESALADLRPTPSPYLIRLPYNARCQRDWMHRARSEFHPDICFASWSFSTRDWILAQGCDNLDAPRKRCGQVARQAGSLPTLPGAILLPHEDPFKASGALSAAVARILLPLLLEQITARGCRLEAIRTHGSDIGRDRRRSRAW